MTTLERRIAELEDAIYNTAQVQSNLTEAVKNNFAAIEMIRDSVKEINNQLKSILSEAYND